MNADGLNFLSELEATIRERARSRPAGSYTVELLEAGAARVAQKIGEEGVELAIAAVAGGRQELLDETADLLYHVLVLLASRDLTLADAVTVLESRHR